MSDGGRNDSRDKHIVAADNLLLAVVGRVELDPSIRRVVLLRGAAAPGMRAGAGSRHGGALVVVDTAGLACLGLGAGDGDAELLEELFDDGLGERDAPDDDDNPGFGGGPDEELVKIVYIRRVSNRKRLDC